MKKTDWRYRTWLFWAGRILKIPYKVDFDLPEDTELYAVGFAWSQEAADRMRGNDILIDQLEQTRDIASGLAGTRKGRRAIKRIAKKAAEK